MQDLDWRTSEDPARIEDLSISDSEAIHPAVLLPVKIEVRSPPWFVSDWMTQVRRSPVPRPQVHVDLVAIPSRGTLDSPPEEQKDQMRSDRPSWSSSLETWQDRSQWSIPAQPQPEFLIVA